MCRLLFAFFWLVSGMGSAMAQELTFPFVEGFVDLPSVTCETRQTGVSEFVVNNPSPQVASIVLRISNLPDSIRLYVVKDKKMMLIDQTGQLMAKLPRSVDMTFTRDKELVIGTVNPGQSTVFRLYLTNRTRAYPKTFSIRMFTMERYRASEALWFYDSQRQQQLIEVFFWGVIAIMFLFTSLQYILLQERLFLYYALYLFLVFIRLLLLNETVVLDGWPGLRAIGFTSRFSLTALFWSLWIYSLFSRTYVGLDIRAPQLDRISRWLGWILFGLGLLDIFVTIQRIYVDFWFITYQFIDIGVVAFGLFHLWILWKNYDQTVKYIFWGVMMLLIGGLASLINQIFPDIAGAETRDRLIWIAAYVGELLCFSLGLVNWQLSIQREKVRVQAILIKQLQENQLKQKQLLEIRSEIARDLHDELGSELSGINILSQVAIDQPALVKSTLVTIGETSRLVMDRMRDIVWNLSLQHLHSDYIAQRMNELTTNVLEHTAIRARLTIDPHLSGTILLPDQWRHLSMIYKEALHNVVKHARASELVVSFIIDKGMAHVTIEDNGIGFESGIETTGNGLLNQQYRASLLNGRLTVVSGLERGTSIYLEFPIKQPA